MTKENDQEKPKKKQPGRGVQPKTHALKTRQASKIRRKKIVKAIIEGKSNQEAGEIAGLSTKTAADQVSQILAEPKTQADFLKAMEKAGLGDDYWIELHAKLANGKRYLPIRGQGDDAPPDAAKVPVEPVEPSEVPGYIAVPDHQAQAKALDIAHKLAGRYTEKHELDIKRPINIVIKKFASRGKPDAEPGKTPKASE